MAEIEIYYPNLEDFNECFYPFNFLIKITRFGIPFVVNAANEQEAIDEMIDFIEEQGWEGLLWSREEEEKIGEDIYEYINGGNHGRYLSTYNVRIERFRCEEKDKVLTI